MIPRRAAPSFLPTTAVLELTYACNHRCVFCSCPWENPSGSFPRRPEMPIGWWRQLTTRLAAMGVVNLAFTGGEPLLKVGLLGLLDHAAGTAALHVDGDDKGFTEKLAPMRLFLLSNGCAMNGEVLECCHRHKVALSLSLPGLTTFAEHTGGGDAQSVLMWLDRAHAAGITTTAAITVTRRNQHELEATIATALVAGADRILLNRFLPGGRGLAHADELALTPAEVVESLDIAEAVLRRAKRKGNVGTEVPRCLIDPARYRNLEISSGCAAARGFFVVGPSGHVRVCNHSPVELNHADNLETLKHNAYWRRFALSDWLPAGCRSCSHSGTCGAGCREATHIVTGAVDGPDVVFLNQTLARRGAGQFC